MILPDSSVWIDFIARRDTPQTDLLGDLLTRRFPIAVGDLIIAEVLQGARSERQFDDVEALLTGFPLVRVADAEIAVIAARNYRALRALGVTPRKTIDTLIATRCIKDSMVLLYSDRDFDPFVQHLYLRSAMDLDPGVT